jgi:hypothetical protein
MDTLFTKLTDGGTIIAIVEILFGLYIVVYAALQAREISVLQKKVTTSMDGSLKGFGYIYFLIQLLLFVVVLIIL